MKRLLAVIGVVAVGVVFTATPVGAAKPDPVLLGVSSEFVTNCTVRATAQGIDMRGRNFVYFVVRGDRGLNASVTLASVDVRTAGQDTSVVADLQIQTGDTAKQVLAYLNNGPIDGRFDNLGFAPSDVNYPCGL